MKLSQQNGWTSLFSTTPQPIGAPLQRTPANIRINLTLVETRIIRYIFVADCIYASVIILFCGGLWKHINFKTGRSRSSKVTDFGTNRKHVCEFLLVLHSNLGYILPRFKDIGGFLLRNWPSPLPYFIRVLGGFPLDQIADVGASQSQWNYFRNTPAYVIRVGLPERHSRTVRWTDGDLLCSDIAQ